MLGKHASQAVMMALGTSFGVAQIAHATGNTDLAPGFVNVELSPNPVPVMTTSDSCYAGAPKDATTAIQSALSAMGAAGGGIVYLPTGTYCIGKHLVVPGATVLKGVFEAPPPTGTGTLFYQTVLMGVENAGMPMGAPLITLSNRGSMIEGVTIFYPNQTDATKAAAGPDTAWTPVIYPPTISAVGDTAIRNVMLLNSYFGINLYNSGRHIVDGVWGQPISTGIQVDNSLDIGRISNVHFWPFWDINVGPPPGPVVAYIQAYGTAFRFGRADWEIVHDCFAYGYNVGIEFDDLGNGGTNGEFSNINFDSVGTGLDIHTTQQYGAHFSNLNIANVNSGTAKGIWAHNEAGTAAINVSNGTIWGATHQAILWEQPNGLLMLSGMRFQTILSGAPAIQINRGRAMIQNSAFEGAAAGLTDVNVASTATSVMVTNNMLFGGALVPASTTSIVLVANNK